MGLKFEYIHRLESKFQAERLSNVQNRLIFLSNTTRSLRIYTECMKIQRVFKMKPQGNLYAGVELLDFS